MAVMRVDDVDVRRQRRQVVAYHDVRFPKTLRQPPEPRTEADRLVSEALQLTGQRVSEGLRAGIMIEGMIYQQDLHCRATPSLSEVTMSCLALEAADPRPVKKLCRASIRLDSLVARRTVGSGRDARTLPPKSDLDKEDVSCFVDNSVTYGRRLTLRDQCPAAVQCRELNVVCHVCRSADSVSCRRLHSSTLTPRGPSARLPGNRGLPVH